MSIALLFRFCILSLTVSFSKQGIGYHELQDGIHLRKLKSVDISNGTNTVYSMAGNNSKLCKVVPIDETKTRELLKTILDGGAKMVDIYLSFENVSKDFTKQTNREMFNPGFWVRTTGKYGRSILLLWHSFQIISLGTLSYDIGELKVVITEKPYGCLKDMNPDDIENLIKHLLLNDFATTEEQNNFDESEHICNLHLKNNDGKSEFIYKCCQHSGECSELYPDIWSMSLSVAIRVVQILAFLYSPLLVPTTWYRSKLAENEYVLNLAKPKNLNVKERCVGSNCVKYMMDDGGDKCFKVNKVRFKIRTYKLVPENRVPVGILRSIYDNLIRCKLRQHPGTKECCNSSVCGEYLYQRCHCQWYRCCQFIMKILMALLLTSPVIIWLVEYFLYEEEEYVSRKKASEARGLTIYYGGSITRLPPTDPFFLMSYALIFICLFIMLLLKCIMKTVGDKHHKMTLFIIRNAFREMRDSQEARSNVYTGSIISILWPFKKFGLFALFIYVFIYWAICIPCVVIMLSIYCFPAVNVSFRIVKQIIQICIPKCVKSSENCLKFFTGKASLFRDINDAIKKEDITNQNKQKTLTLARKGVVFVYAVLCLLLLLACLLIVLECIGFYVQLIMYTLIGIIINASKTLKFLMLIFMIAFYVRDCLNGVTSIYLNFNQQISKAVQSICSDEVAKITEKCAALQENTAFQVNPDNIDPELDITCKKVHGIQKWEMKRTVLFIDKYDKPFITKKFFHDACNMKYAGCPGPVMPHLIRAVIQIISIIVFLLFVIFVVLAFGDEYISGTNQTMVTLAGGLLPFIFRKVISAPTKGITVDVNNLNFKNGFHDLINNYVQTWPISNKYIEKTDCTCSDETETPEESIPIPSKDKENESNTIPSAGLDDDNMDIVMGMGLGAMAMVAMDDGTMKDKSENTKETKVCNDDTIDAKPEVSSNSELHDEDRDEERVLLLSTPSHDENDDTQNV